jgi:hypothetical protein
MSDDDDRIWVRIYKRDLPLMMALLAPDVKRDERDDWWQLADGLLESEDESMPSPSDAPN